MSNPNRFVSRVYIKKAGSDVDRPVMQKLTELVVDQHTHMPDMFVLQFRDTGLELLDNGPFNLTDEIEIEAANADGERVVLIKGEITALEPAFGEGMVSVLTVRGYDKSHRLYRETKTATYLNAKDSDLADRIAQAAGLQTEVDTTNTVYDHIFQHNQSDLEFLMDRAWRIGFECFVSEDKLVFRKPKNTASPEVTLTWGNDLLTFDVRMTLAEQVDQVIVKGWDVDRKEAIIGEADNGSLYPEIEESQNGARWASDFGTGKKVIVDQPVISQAEADALAAARLDEISGAFVEAEGTAFRRPEIKAGERVRIEGLGDRMTGSYLVTNATHSFTTEGLKTVFTVRGTRTGLLTEQVSNQLPSQKWPGVVTAIVTNTDDPNDWGRVKLKFPWMSDDAESDWARVIGIGAGEDAGFFAIPDVDDEVLVIFEHGDFSKPYVIGGLWNGQTIPTAEGTSGGTGERPQVRVWKSRSGHWIAMYDNADNKVDIGTAGGHLITLDDANSEITITSSGGHTIVMDSSKVTIESGNEVEIKSSGNMKIEAGANLDLTAGGQVNVQGAMINLN